MDNVNSIRLAESRESGDAFEPSKRTKTSLQTTDLIDKSFLLRFAIFSFCARSPRAKLARLRPLGFLIRPVDLRPAGRGQFLDKNTVDLDGRQGMAAQKATGVRRQLAAVDEAVAKARYLLTLFAQTPAAEDPRRVRLIAEVLADFERLLAEPPARRG
jgi:hypothetical protein